MIYTASDISYNFIRHSTIIREMHISAENIFYRADCKKKKKKKKRSCRERPTNLARRWSSLNSLGVTRSWNVLWKLLWKALRAMDRTGAPSSLLLHTCCHGDEPPPSETPRGPILILRLSLSFPLRAATQRAAFSLSILESASFFIIIISVVDTSSLVRSYLSLFFLFFRTLVLLGYISRPVFSSAEFFSRRRRVKLRLTFREGHRNANVVCIRKRVSWRFEFFLMVNFLKGSHFFSTIRTIVVVRAALMSAVPRWCPLPGQLDLLSFFVLQLSSESESGGKRGDGEVLLTLDAVQSLQ